jgi:predicted small metal-binding protein
MSPIEGKECPEGQGFAKLTPSESPEKGGVMGAKVINCECGQVVRGETDDELVANVEEHVRSDHPELVGKMSREDIIAMAEAE